MKIKKTETSVGVLGKITNTQSTSTTDTYSCSYVNNITNYSTNETVVGKWIDGKKIYRKVFELSSSGAHSSAFNISTNVINDVETVVFLDGYYNDSGSGISKYIIKIGQPAVSGVSYNSYIGYNKDEKKIQVVFAGSASTVYCHIIFEYTKTTD